MTGFFRDVTEAELGVLRALWKSNPLAIREIAMQVYGSNSESNNATVKKLLSRLEKKGLVTRNRDQIPHMFEAIDRAELLDRRLKGLADELCEGSQTPLLMTLLNSESATEEQREKLRNLIDEIASNRKARKPRSSGRKS